MIVGLVHPGAMGAAIGDALVAAGHEVVWASEGRSAATRARAGRFRDVGTVAALERLRRAERSAAEKGWRWAGEMDEIAATFATVGRPEGFHRAAGEVFRS